MSGLHNTIIFFFNLNNCVRYVFEQKKKILAKHDLGFLFKFFNISHIILDNIS